jgi:hypothetical protein
MICGFIVAVSSYAFFEVVGAAYYLLAGVLIGNVWEAWRRWNSQRRKLAYQEPSAAEQFVRRLQRSESGSP